MNWDYALDDYYQVKAMSKQLSSDHEMAIATNVLPQHAGPPTIFYQMRAGLSEHN
jgi:hypothetical protein